MIKIILGLLIACTQCVLPPPIEEATTPSNQPPHIVPSSLTPDPTKGPRHMLTTGCPPYLFLAQLVDPDVQDTLYWRVFINYNRQDPENLIATEVHQYVQTDNPTPISFSIDAQDPSFNNPVGSGIPDQVELLVSDRPFATDTREPVGRSVLDNGLSDAFIWTVYRTNDACASGGAP